MILTDGAYKILYIKVSGTYYPIGCLTKNNFTEATTMLGTTTRANEDGWRTGRPTGQEYNINFNGLIDISGSTTIISYRDIVVLKRARTKIEWKIENSKGGDVDFGEGHFVSLGDDATIDNFTDFTGSIEGFGKPLIEIGNAYIDNDYIEDYYI